MLRVLAATPGETVPRLALAGNGGSRQRARRRRAGQPAAPQDRARSGQSADRADRARHRLSAGGVAMTSARRRHRASAFGGRPRVRRLGPRRRSGSRRMHAEGPLCPRAAHHHRADGDPAVGRRLRVHGAALEHGDAASVRRGGAGHRGADRRSTRSIRRTPTTRSCAHRAGAAWAWWSISCRSPKCRRRARSRSSRCSTRRCRRSCASRSGGRSGSTRSAARRWSKSASSSTTR